MPPVAPLDWPDEEKLTLATATKEAIYQLHVREPAHWIPRRLANLFHLSIDKVALAW